MQIKTETKVGLFVIITLVTFLYIANYLGTFKWHLPNYKSYKVLFNNASGLVKQADVKIAGVKVGWVDQIKLIQNGSRVELVLMINHHYQLYQDAMVEVRQESLLGNKFIEIQPGSLGLVTNEHLIGKASASIDELICKFDQMANKIDFFVEQLDPISKDLTRITKRFDQILDHDYAQLINNLNAGIDTAQSIAQKVDQGFGSFGKLINEDDIYQSIKASSNKFKQAAEVYDNVGWVVDSHLEAMARTAGGYEYKNAKSYLGGRLHLNKDWYALLQLVGSDQGGVVDRDQRYVSYFDQNGQLLTPADLAALGCSYSVVPSVTKESVIRRDTLTYSLQIGKLFLNHNAFRFGFFESYFGMALDWDIPFNSDNVRWVSSLEIFDFKGQNRLEDRRPHLKWLNKLFLFKSCYFAFGVDDFASKSTASPFFGMGIRFGGDDYDACVK